MLVQELMLHLMQLNVVLLLTAVKVKKLVKLNYKIGLEHITVQMKLNGKAVDLN